MYGICLFGSMATAGDGVPDAVQGVGGRCAHLLDYLVVRQGRHAGRSATQESLPPDGAGSLCGLRLGLRRMAR